MIIPTNKIGRIIFRYSSLHEHRTAFPIVGNEDYEILPVYVVTAAGVVVGGVVSIEMTICHPPCIFFAVAWYAEIVI
jgi:hypothetical protein